MRKLTVASKHQIKSVECFKSRYTIKGKDGLYYEQERQEFNKLVDCNWA